MAFASIQWPDTGEMTRQITIRKWVDVPNAESLGIDQTLETGLTCWAKVQPVTGALYWMGKQIDNEIDVIFWVRYYDGTKDWQITGEHVVDFQNRRYRVKRATNAGDAQRFTMIEATTLGLIPTVASTTPLVLPFAPDSIWNRKIPSDATYADIYQALWVEKPDYKPISLYLDIITTIETDPRYPLVNFRLNTGTDYPARAQSTGETLFTKRLAFGAAFPASRVRKNYLCVYDPMTCLVDEASYYFRASANGDITKGPYSADYHAFNDTGLYGLRTSGLSALGGAIRGAEPTGGIAHALALSLPATLLNNNRVWPASGQDLNFNDSVYGYLGTDPNLTIGTLLAIPPATDLGTLQFNTGLGIAIATAAQVYGLYVADTAAPLSNSFGLAFDRNNAEKTLNFAENVLNGDQTFDSSEALRLDLLAILSQCQAVTSNAP